MDRYWLLTSTTYGTWLPGDRRGFVGHHVDMPGQRVVHARPGEPLDADLPRLEIASRELLKGPPIYLSRPQAEALVVQFQETAAYRQWLLLAAAVMRSHFHVVVGVDGDPDPGRILGDFKSHGSRRLNQQWTRPASGTWWTSSGSKRKVLDEAAVAAAVRYVQNQKSPLLVWTHPSLTNR